MFLSSLYYRFLLVFFFYYIVNVWYIIVLKSLTNCLSQIIHVSICELLWMVDSIPNEKKIFRLEFRTRQLTVNQVGALNQSNRMFTYIFYIEVFWFAIPTRICLSAINENILKFIKIFEVIDLSELFHCWNIEFFGKSKKKTCSN